MTLPQITATGNLARDPELKYTQSGKAVVNLSIGCNENKKDDAGNWQTVSTTWLGTSLWDAEAEAAAEHLRKGDMVTIVGQLSEREYDKSDGTKGKALDVKYARVSKNLPKSQAARSSGQQGGGGWGGGPAPTPQAAPQQSGGGDPWGAQTEAPF